MTSPPSPFLSRLESTLADLDPSLTGHQCLTKLVHRQLDRLPLPGSGGTADRWRALALVAMHDLSLAKLYEGHTDALAIMQELGGLAEPAADDALQTWGVWAAEAPQGRTHIVGRHGEQVVLNGLKCWCSGAEHGSHALLTAWQSDGSGPQLCSVALAQPGVEILHGTWVAVGMAGSKSLDVRFDKALARPIGAAGDYLSRPGFWQGGAGVAACWYGGALGIAAKLRLAVQSATSQPDKTRQAALGKVDMALRQTQALLIEAADWIDEHPNDDASEIALRVRLSAESCARLVLDETGRTLGAAPYCRDRHFAVASADLPVFIRQSHGDRDCAALAERVSQGDARSWML